MYNNTAEFIKKGAHANATCCLPVPCPPSPPHPALQLQHVHCLPLTTRPAAQNTREFQDTDYLCTVLVISPDRQPSCVITSSKPVTIGEVEDRQTECGAYGIDRTAWIVVCSLELGQAEYARG
jgi:hypothetical protein